MPNFVLMNSQDAMFSGTLRDNLDPFSELYALFPATCAYSLEGDHDDTAYMDALYRVHMISDNPTATRGQSTAASLSSSRPTSINGSTTDVDVKPTVSLDTQVSAGGTNFPQGQRQLIAMARALIRRSSVVVMNEATSNVIFATDAKIQKAMREEFTESLLISGVHPSFY